VLPLANVGADTSAQYFSDGMTDELIATLSQVEGCAWRRGRRRSSTRIGVCRLRKSHGRSNVNTVLEGSAWREGNRVRITLQLVPRSPKATISGRKTYEREVQDVFACNRTSVAMCGRVERCSWFRAKERLSGAQRIRRRTTCIFWGEYYWNTRTRDGVLKATGFFQRAIARDFELRSGVYGLADSYNVLRRV